MSTTTIETNIEDVFPAPENDKFNRPVDRTDPAFRQLVESVADRGILELSCAGPSTA
jgi:hypothetical protein